MLDRITDRQKPWDFVVIGGGATGLATALEAASRGYDTLLLERGDFASGTSSRSSKLIHGGMNYLKEGNVSLVLEALRERGLLMRNAAHLVRNRSFIIPTYDWWKGPFVGIGLKVYDSMAGNLGLGPSRTLSIEETLEQIPALEREGLIGGVLYQDGQFDDVRLAIALAQTLVERGGTAVNYLEVRGLMYDDDLVCGVEARDREGSRRFKIGARAVINATGPYADAIRRLDEKDAEPIMAPSQGVHLVLDAAFRPGERAMMAPLARDGRVLFIVPWNERLLIGTTETPVQEISPEPRPMAWEIEYLLTHAARFLTREPRHDDILSVFAGLRPHVRVRNREGTTSLARDHTVVISKSGLITIAGGQWTTHRKMGEDTIDEAAGVAGLDERKSITRGLRLRGWPARMKETYPWKSYGSDADALRSMAQEKRRFREPLHPRLPYLAVQVIWAVRHEMARTVEDVLARRTRALLLDARASMEIAPRVAELMATELDRDAAWCEKQVKAFETHARGYLPV